MINIHKIARPRHSLVTNYTPSSDLIPQKYEKKRKLASDLTSNDVEFLGINYPSSTSTLNEENEYDDNIHYDINVDIVPPKQKKIIKKTPEQLEILHRYLKEAGTELPSKKFMLEASLETKLELKNVLYFFQHHRRTNNKKSGKRSFVKVPKTDEQIQILQTYFIEANMKKPSLEIRNKIRAETNLSLCKIGDWFHYQITHNEGKGVKNETASYKKTSKRKTASLENKASIQVVPIVEKKTKSKKESKVSWESVLNSNSSMPTSQQQNLDENLKSIKKQKTTTKQQPEMQPKPLPLTNSNKLNKIDPYEFSSEPILKLSKTSITIKKNTRRCTLAPEQILKTLHETPFPPHDSKQRRESLFVAKSKNYPPKKSNRSMSFSNDIIPPTEIVKNNVYLQSKACFEYTNSNIDCCRECSIGSQNREDCRFYDWRKLNNKNDVAISCHGFLSDEDITEKDRNIWCNIDEKFIKANIEASVNINEFEIHLKNLYFLEKSFQLILDEENEWKTIVQSEADRKVFWKKLIEGMRETCDLCRTYIFNGHFACTKCGFSVCLHCFKLDRNNSKAIGTKNKFEVDDKNWLFCNSVSANNSFEKNQPKRKKVEHMPNQMVYIHFIPSDVFEDISSQFKNVIVKLKEKQLWSINNSKVDPKKFDKMTTIVGSNNSNALECDKFLLLDSTANAKTDKKYLKNYEKSIFDIFDSEWQKRKPIIMKNVHKRMNQNIWTCKWFTEKYENNDIKVDLVNCENDSVLVGQSMKWFWKGFEGQNDDDLINPKKQQSPQDS